LEEEEQRKGENWRVFHRAGDRIGLRMKSEEDFSKNSDQRQNAIFHRSFLFFLFYIRILNERAPRRRGVDGENYEDFAMPKKIDQHFHWHLRKINGILLRIFVHTQRKRQVDHRYEPTHFGGKI